MDGSNQQKLSHHKVANWFDETDGNLYYTVANTKGEFNLYKAESSGEDTPVLKDPLESVRAVNNKIICKLVAGNDYGVKILDKSGDVNLAITDQASAVYAYNDSILVVSATDKSIKLVK
jgi:hypothetical protein